MDFVKLSSDSKRPAVKKAVKKLTKSVVTRDEKKINQAVKVIESTTGKATGKTSGNQVKKVARRVNQSAVAKGGKARSTYAPKGK